ncbi:MAG: pyridoxal-phosphate dependent enzyme [Acidobacteria bacterium]|nr:pyridoxal-phosphate dependent enzyme [Acidobacteriota bacterium]MCG3190942.1 putative cystathionine beta-synthase [Thermoanaerobaculia bacterium]MCK6684543.1 pyridoxal-phosphate dependent enzyme [Thermoanaerobaculia bacterium]
MKHHENILSLIGGTPLIKLHRLTAGLRATVLAKMENLNPGGSVKDRIGLSMVEAAEREGLLKPGSTIVEATSGNTGIGLALAAAVKGYKCVFVMTDKASVEKSRYLKALGADVVITPVTAKPGSPDHYVETARRIARETPNSFFPFQYANTSNPDAHYRTTGPELWEQTAGRITHFVAGLGTGGTISGTGRYLKERNPGVRVVGADPYGSIFKTYKETGHVPQVTPYLVEGIGQEVIPENAHLRYVDEIINVTDKESFDLSRQLGRLEGIFCGGSTGTNLAAALRVARDLDESGLVVFIVCDTGERYLSKHHSDEWMREKRMLEPQRITAGLLAKTKNTRAAPEVLVSAASSETVATALARMDELGLSQLPVLENGRCVGSLRENRVLARVLADRALVDSPVSVVMGEPFPVLDVDAPLAEVVKELQSGPAVLVEEYGRIISMLTRHDVLDATAMASR